MITLVITKGEASLDIYAQKIAEHLNVPKLNTDIYQKIRKRFNTPLLSRTFLKNCWQDLRWVMTLNKIDGVVHLPNHHLGRYGLFLKIPYIITVHDLIRYLDLKGDEMFISNPSPSDRFYLSLDYRGIKKAARVIAVSEATKRDLVHYLGIPEERISVVYEGVDHRLFKPTSRRLVDFPYILFVGSEHPRKNFGRVLKAFAKLKSHRRFKDLKLVKVGSPGGSEREFRKDTLETIEELDIAREVIFTDYVAEEDLPAYYSGAECYLLPSFYEGFGLPPVEAMACGCPVIVSNVTSLPEVTGEASVKVDPFDVDDITGAVKQVLSDVSLRQELISKGLDRARHFSWKKAARETLKVYQSVERALRARQTPAEVAERATPPM